jgi:hypothetical protein
VLDALTLLSIMRVLVGVKRVVGKFILSSVIFLSCLCQSPRHNFITNRKNLCSSLSTALPPSPPLCSSNLDYAVKVRVAADKKAVDLANVKMSMNPFCEVGGF